MRRLLVLAVLFLALYGCAAEGEADEGSAAAPGEAEAEAEEAPMEEKEKRALYAAIESFVGKGWNGSGLFPDPCGQTPIQVRSPVLDSWQNRKNCCFLLSLSVQVTSKLVLVPNFFLNLHILCVAHCYLTSTQIMAKKVVACTAHS
jgi:hypothetical protein